MSQEFSVPDSILVKNQTFKEKTKTTNVYFIGQIVGAEGFLVGQDGLFVEATLHFGEEWSLVQKDSYVNSGSLHTHTAFADEEGFHVFAHPFQHHF